MGTDEWRVEVDLDDEQHGYPLGEKVRSLDLDDEVRARLGGGVIVTRDGPRVFVYAATDEAARAAQQIVREQLARDGLSASVSLTRWHPIEEAWRDAALPLPRTDAEADEERQRHEAREEREARLEGEYDWRVRVATHHRRDAVALEQALEVDGLAVRRRFLYLTVGAPTEERAQELAAWVAERTPAGTRIWVEPNPEDLPHTPFEYIPPLF